MKTFIKNKIQTFLHWQSRHIASRNFILILSAIVGLIAGVNALLLKTAVFFLRDLLLIKIGFSYRNLMLIILPAVGIAMTLLIRGVVIKDWVKHNISSILHSISKHNSLVRRHKIYSSLLGGIFTAGFGGSIGLESPIISSGAAVGSNLGKILKLNYKTVTLLLACGTTGAIAAIFNTPIAAIVFAIEVLLIDLTRFSLIPLLISATSGAIVTKIFSPQGILFNFQVSIPFEVRDIPFFLAFGIIAGLVSIYFTRVYIKIETWFEERKLRRHRFLIGSSLLGLMIFLFPALYGEGFETVKALLYSSHEKLMDNTIANFLKHPEAIVLIYLFALMLLKVVATAITIGAGGVGGIFAPSLFTGAVVGFLYISVLNITGLFGHPISTNNYTLVGMAAVLGGVLQAPLTGIFLITEMTSGYELIVPLMLSTTISFLTVKFFQPYGIITFQLANRGELITHHKDKAVLTLMQLKSVIETDLKTVHINSNLGDMVKIVAQSKRNIFPVLNNHDHLMGIVLLDNIREIMFDKSKYDDVQVENLMIYPPAFIQLTDLMEEVMQKFQDTQAWNLPVVEGKKYIGFVSKSKMFEVYRKLLVDISAE